MGPAYGLVAARTPDLLYGSTLHIMSAKHFIQLVIL
jgi:hypothetical protein